MTPPPPHIYIYIYIHTYIHTYIPKGPSRTKNTSAPAEGQQQQLKTTSDVTSQFPWCCRASVLWSVKEALDVASDDPPDEALSCRVNLGTGRKFGTDVAKRCGEGSEMLVFLGKRGRKTVQTVKNYGGSKIRSIFRKKGPLGTGQEFCSSQMRSF